MTVYSRVDLDVRLEEAQAEPGEYVFALVRVRSAVERAHSKIDLLRERLVHVQAEVLTLEAVQLLDDARLVRVLE